MRVRSKPVEYEAFQLTAEQFTAADVPEWLGEAWRRLSDEDEAFWRVNYADGTAASFVRIKGKGTHVEVDDWILRDPDGALSVLTPAQFAELEVIEA